MAQIRARYDEIFAACARTPGGFEHEPDRRGFHDVTPAERRDDGAPLRSPRDVWAAFAPRLEDLPVEEFHVAVLDAQHRLERDITITRGILNSSLVHPREVFREAIAERAAAIVLVHNHPSGDPSPSTDDRAITTQLVQAGRVLDIPVADHVVIGRGRYLSFAEAGLL
jgi:DNA repair protein RadC